MYLRQQRNTSGLGYINYSGSWKGLASTECQVKPPSRAGCVDVKVGVVAAPYFKSTNLYPFHPYDEVGMY